MFQYVFTLISIHHVSISFCCPSSKKNEEVDPESEFSTKSNLVSYLNTETPLTISAMSAYEPYPKSTDIPDKVDCQKNPNHSWCLTTLGKECERYSNVTKKPIICNKEKQLLVDLHNNYRKEVTKKCLGKGVI